MTENKIKLYSNENKINGIFGGIQYELTCNGDVVNSEGTDVFEIIVEEKPVERQMKKTTYSKEEIIVIVDKAEILDEEDKEKLYNLLVEYKDVFSDQPGLIKDYEHKIIMKDETPFYLRSYPIPHIYKEEVGKQIQEMLDWKVNEKSQTNNDDPIRISMDARHLYSKIGGRLYFTICGAS